MKRSYRFHMDGQRLTIWFRETGSRLGKPSANRSPRAFWLIAALAFGCFVAGGPTRFDHSAADLAESRSEIRSGLATWDDAVQWVSFAQAHLQTSATGLHPCADWEPPLFALFCTGRQNGYIEPCGCTGLENAKGGLSRRYTFWQQLRERGWNVVPVDVGNQVRRFGPQPELKLQTTATVLRLMNYAGVALGPDDLRLSIGELASVVAGSGEGNDAVFISANANLLDLNPRFRTVEVAGKKLGIVAILGTEEQKSVNSPEIEFSAAKEAITNVLADPELENCDFLILLAHASTRETNELAEAFPQFQVIVSAGGAGEPPLEPLTIAGSDTQIVQVGTKGMYVGVLGYYPNASPAFRFERVELDARFPDTEIVMTNFALYQRQLQDLGLQGLGLRPVPHPSGKQFVGHEVCGDCHTAAYEIFENTPHFHATDSIAFPTERSEIVRHHDPECLSCHVTGWNPQEYFPYVSGYLDFEQSKHLHANGCENCHGPGSDHVAAESGDEDVSEEEQEKRRAEMRISLEEARKSKCYECHDLDNSPDFEFDSYWEEVKHYGKD